MLTKRKNQLLERRKALLQIIYENSENGISKLNIRKKLKDEDFCFSNKTVDRDLRAFQDNSTITTVLDKSSNQKKYKIENLENAQLFNDFTDAIEKFYHEAKKIPNQISRGIEPTIAKYISGARDYNSDVSFRMSTVLLAMLENYSIEFNYTKYGETSISDRIIEPYHLRLKDNLWYLVGKEPDTGLIKVFGLDRITNLKLTDDQFKRDPNFNPQAYFKNYIGIYTNEGRNPELIKIKVWGDFIKRLKSLPLHESQKTESEAQDQIIITLNVVPNTEFYTEILKLRNYAAILSPDSVKNKMREFLNNMLKAYE
jgi:Fe2+ or Zn2+ uptake regulation protein